MAVTLPPAPYKIPIADRSGKLSTPWARWFAELFRRVGESVAPSITELNEMPTNLQTQITTLQSQVAALQNELGQGRTL